MDCGVALGLCNIIVGYVETQLDCVDRYVCYVGGLPKVRQWPYEYYEDSIHERKDTPLSWSC